MPEVLEPGKLPFGKNPKSVAKSLIEQTRYEPLLAELTVDYRVLHPLSREDFYFAQEVRHHVLKEIAKTEIDC